MLKSKYNYTSEKQKPEVSLIIAFYNKIDFLKLVFASLETQTFKNFEVLICDENFKIFDQVQALKQFRTPFGL